MMYINFNEKKFDKLAKKKKQKTNKRNIRRLPGPKDSLEWPNYMHRIFRLSFFLKKKKMCLKIVEGKGQNQWIRYAKTFIELWSHAIFIFYVDKWKKKVGWKRDTDVMLDRYRGTKVTKAKHVKGISGSAQIFTFN